MGKDLSSNIKRRLETAIGTLDMLSEMTRGSLDVSSLHGVSCTLALVSDSLRDLTSLALDGSGTEGTEKCAEDKEEAAFDHASLEPPYYAVTEAEEEEEYGDI